jgi:hypothetical protein
MDKKAELDCCVSILEFLMVLEINNTDMIPFTEYINQKYYNNYYNLDDLREFFSTNKSYTFYKCLIRKLKLELYIL